MTEDGREPKGSHQGRKGERVADLGALRALSHPIRIVLYDLLSQYGPATASGLAARIGESSGTTSYHLRQLARHDLVREIEGRGTARERWWERTPGPLAVSVLEGDDPSALDMTRTVVMHWHELRDRQLGAFLRDGDRVLPEAWAAASNISTVNLRLTSDQLEEYVREWNELSDRLHDRFRGQDLPGSRPVQIHFNAFPLIDGEETPS